MQCSGEVSSLIAEQTDSLILENHTQLTDIIQTTHCDTALWRHLVLVKKDIKEDLSTSFKLDTVLLEFSGSVQSETLMFNITKTTRNTLKLSLIFY